VRKGEKKHRGSRPRRRGETCGRGRYGGAGAALAETGESRQAKRDSDWREPDEEVWKTDSTSSAWLTLYELIPLSERGYPRHFIRVCHPRVPCARRDARRPNKTTTAGVDEGKDIVLWAACQRAVSEQVDTYSGESAMKRERRENGHVVSGEREAKEKKLWTASIRRNEKIAIPFQPPPLSHPPSRFFIFFSHHVLPLRRSHCSRWRSASALDVRCDIGCHPTTRIDRQGNCFSSRIPLLRNFRNSSTMLPGNGTDPDERDGVRRLWASRVVRRSFLWQEAGPKRWRLIYVPQKMTVGLWIFRGISLECITDDKCRLPSTPAMLNYGYFGINCTGLRRKCNNTKCSFVSNARPIRSHRSSSHDNIFRFVSFSSKNLLVSI